jgi:hypothetical protein
MGYSKDSGASRQPQLVPAANPSERRNQVRLIKMFGLAAIAAVAAMAFVAASSASATSTVLCKVNQLVCPAGEEYAGSVSALAESPVLLTDLGEVLCDHSVIAGTALGLATPLLGHITLIDFTGNCHIGVTGCTITTKKLGTLLLLKTGTNVGTAEAHNNEVLVNCAGVIHCVYGGLFTAEALGYNDTTEQLALIHAKKAAVKQLSGLLCPKEALWDALYTVTSPHKVYISE